MGRPVPAGGPREHWPPSGFSLESKARLRPGRSPLLDRLSLLVVRTFLAHLVFRTGIKVGGFDPRLYKRQLVDNTDFRKFDDGLRMTLDCPPELADRIEAQLAQAEAAGSVRFGLHRQDRGPDDLLRALGDAPRPRPFRRRRDGWLRGGAGGEGPAGGRASRDLSAMEDEHDEDRSIWRSASS